MSITRKCLDRKHFMNKLEQVKLDINGDILRCSLGQTVKRDNSQQNRRSKDKYIKVSVDNANLKMPSSCKNSKKCQIIIDKSKESKESRDSLMKSTHSYYIAHKRDKRSGSVASKHLKSQKSKELTNTSNLINSTFQMQSFISTHKKKKSNFSSTVGSKFDMIHLNKSAVNNVEIKDQMGSFGELLLKSETILQNYRTKYEQLERQNKKYKKKYQQAIKKIRLIENKN